MDGTEEGRAPAARRRRMRLWGGVVAAILVLGSALAGVTVATAQTQGPAVEKLPGLKALRGDRMMKAHAIHGEFTVKNRDGGYRTMATQAGEVTSVSSSSIAVKSEDGFSRTYTVNDQTRVLAGEKGIADVAKGDTVRVMAVVEDGKAKALHVVDVSKVKLGKREGLRMRRGGLG